MRHQVPFKGRAIVSTEYQMALILLILREFEGKYILIESSFFDHHSKWTVIPLNKLVRGMGCFDFKPCPGLMDGEAKLNMRIQ